jgi:glycosyltransferase involved in cell wall biosynthesis
MTDPVARADAPRVTVGLPLYNGAEYLDGCLASIARQTFTAFTAFAIDNGSSDETPDILASYGERDRRFTSRRNVETKLAIDNFFDVLAAADTEYFLWRAYDDYTSDNFLEETVRLLDSNPRAELAVSRVVSLKPHKNKVRAYRIPPQIGVPAIDLPAMMFRSHASWFYGLWRTEALRAVMKRAWAAYPDIWANDHLVLFDLMVRGKVVGSNAATFFQRVVDRPYKQPPEGDRELAERVRKLNGMRRRFGDYCTARLAEAELDPLTAAIVRRLLPAYVSKRVYRRRKLNRLSRRLQASAATSG